MMAAVKGRINLFSPVLAPSGPGIPGKPWWLLGVGLLIVLMVVGLTLQQIERWKLARAISAAQTKFAAIQGEQQLLDDRLNLLTSGLSTQVTTASAGLVEVISKRLAWVELFQEMSTRVPDGVWLLHVDIDAMAPTKGQVRAQKRTILLSGFARSHQSVSQLLSALEQSPKFRGIALKFSGRRSGTKGDQVDFEIQGQLI